MLAWLLACPALRRLSGPAHPMCLFWLTPLRLCVRGQRLLLPWLALSHGLLTAARANCNPLPACRSTGRTLFRRWQASARWVLHHPPAWHTVLVPPAQCVSECLCPWCSSGEGVHGSSHGMLLLLLLVV